MISLEEVSSPSEFSTLTGLFNKIDIFVENFNPVRVWNSDGVCFIKKLPLREISTPSELKTLTGLTLQIKKMNLELATPALLFSATSLILLAYTNRFLTIAQIIRSLKKNYDEDRNSTILEQIKNLNLRLNLIRYMQLFGVLSLFLSVFAMLLLFVNQQLAGIYLFSFSLLSLLVSLAISFWEISISVSALQLHLSDLIDNSKK